MLLMTLVAHFLAVTLSALASTKSKTTSKLPTSIGSLCLAMAFELPASIFKATAKRQLPAQLKGDVEDLTENSGAAASDAVARPSQPQAKKPKNKSKLSLEDLTELAQATAQLSLETKMDTRVHDALLTRTILADADHVAVKAALDEGQEIHKEQMQKRGQDLGSPFLRISLKFFQSIAYCPEVSRLDENHPMKIDMEAWWKLMQGWNETQMKEEIPLFQVTKPRVQSRVDGLPSYAKIRFALGPRSAAFQETFENFCTNELKWISKTGVAPQTQRERKVRQLMRNLA